ncbi:MAG TPA: porin [Vicinamibacterales bacterium]
MSVNVARRILSCTALALLVGTLPAAAQIVIKGDDDMNFKLGVLGQFQADTIDNPNDEPNTNNLFVRRLRLMFGGQVHKNVSFFAETDTPNLGKTLPAGKNIQPSMILQDAYVEVRFADALLVDAGLMFVPFSRNALQSAATLLPIDYGAYTFSDSAPEQSATGRDTGFQARGYFAGNHLEYRIGVFQGMRDGGSDNSFRYTGRVQYNALDPESGFFYTGTYLGKKRILAIGAAFDTQKDFHAYDADVFFDYPVGPGAVTAQFDYNHFDGGVTLTTLPKQNDVLVEGGYLIRALKLTPLVQIAHRDISDLSAGDETRVAGGANYWWAGHNVNVKGLCTRISPTGLAAQNEFTVQLQVFVF